jgi:hypothetical protein
MTTTTAAFRSGRADGNGPTQDAHPPTGSRMRSSRPGRSCFRFWIAMASRPKGFDPAAYDGLCAIPRDRASRE